LLCLIHHCIFIYVLNTSGWQTLKKLNSSRPAAQTTLWFLEGSRNSATLQSTTARSLHVYRLPNARPRAKSAAAHSTIFRCSSWLVPTTRSRILLLLWCCSDVCIHLAPSKETLISVPYSPPWVDVARMMRAIKQVAAAERVGIRVSTVPTCSKYCYHTRLRSHTVCKTCLEGNLH